MITVTCDTSKVVALCSTTIIFLCCTQDQAITCTVQNVCFCLEACCIVYGSRLVIQRSVYSSYDSTGTHITGDVRMVLTIFYLYGTGFVLKLCITGNPADSICLTFLYSIRKRCFDLSFYRKSGHLSC